MCGILGTIPATDPVAFEQALTCIAHRGPDGAGIWRGNADVSLGHRRLSIIDVSDAASQPMHRYGRYHMVYNGEIYNFLEIRRELESIGEVFTTESDTEVLLSAFARWGKDCLPRLNGMWALAIWDSQEKSLFLARDRMGEKPLYYLLDERRLIFASEQKAILPFVQHVRAADNFHALCRNPYAYEGTSQTLIAGISRFPAAHYAWYKQGTLQSYRYWAPAETALQIPADYEGQVEALRELLLDSTRMRLRADVPVASALSGGVDSAAVASAIARIGKQQNVERLPENWQNAFVASFPGSAIDETAPARSIAKHLGINLREILISTDAARDDLEHISYLFEDVHEVNPLPHANLYKEMRRQGVFVSLDGHGGDELFGGYESSILHALPSALGSSRDIGMLLGTYHAVHPASEQFRGMSIPRMAAYLLRSEVRDRRKFRQWDAPMRHALKGQDSLNRHLMRLSFDTVLPTLLRNYDRYSMMNGVEIRIPLLDHRIVDFAFGLSWRSKLRNGYSKAVLRDAARPWLPPSIMNNRTKIGFAPPIVDWMRGSLREYILDEISSDAFRTANMIDPLRLGKSLGLIIKGEGAAMQYGAEAVWKEFSIYLWEKNFMVRQPWKKKLDVSASEVNALHVVGL